MLYLAGIDDPHYYRADNLEKACDPIPPGATSILLSHSPEIYRQAAHVGFKRCSVGILMGGRSVCRVASRCCAMRAARAGSTLAPGPISNYRAIPQWDQAPRWSMSASTVSQKSHSITCAERKATRFPGLCISQCGHALLDRCITGDGSGYGDDTTPATVQSPRQKRSARW